MKTNKEIDVKHIAWFAGQAKQGKVDYQQCGNFIDGLGCIVLELQTENKRLREELCNQD